MDGICASDAMGPGKEQDAKEVGKKDYICFQHAASSCIKAPIATERSRIYTILERKTELRTIKIEQFAQ